MEVVLNEDVKKLGYKGNVVNVKRGFFRNFLFPKGLADVATQSRKALAESRKEKVVVQKQQLMENAADVLTKIKGLKVVVHGKVSDKGKLYGSITEDDVIAAVEAAAKIKLEREFLKMSHFKEVGEHKAIVHLGEGLEEEITVEVKSLFE
jgi:large subunit ribosomal protein L9